LLKKLCGKHLEKRSSEIFGDKLEKFLEKIVKFWSSEICWLGDDSEIF